jgi:hypothetical protein
MAVKSEPARFRTSMGAEPRGTDACNGNINHLGPVRFSGIVKRGTSWKYTVAPSALSTKMLRFVPSHPWRGVKFRISGAAGSSVTVTRSL